MRYFPLFLISVFLFLLSPNAMGQTKRAFLIGIGKYPRGNGWNNLSSENDLQYLTKVLQLKGFENQYITEITNEAATQAGITAAMEKFIASCKQGDIIVLHFSGHGQQITDDDGDEADGYDEAWVPYDAKARFDPVEYRGQKHIRDDQIGIWVDLLAKAVGGGGSVLVNIDACHSGTATRAQALAVARGTPTPFKLPGAATNAYRTPNGAASEFLSSSNLQKANVVVFSASSPIQINYETVDDQQQGVGSLSYCFAQSLATLPAGATYADLFYRVKANIQSRIPNQIPMMEGNANQQLFAGNYKNPESRLYIDRWVTDSSFVLAAGSLQQLIAGTELALIDPDTKKQVAMATVQSASPVESIAITKTKLNKSGLWICEIRSTPVPPFSLAVNYDLKTLPKSWIPTLDKAIKEFGFTIKSDHPDCWISYVADTGLVVITKSNGIAYSDATAGKNKITEQNMAALQTALKQMAKVQYMRNLPDGGSLAETVKWEVIPHIKNPETPQDFVFTAGSLFDLKLTNKGSKPVYFSLINLLPDGTMEVLLPDAASAVEDFSVQPGESFEITDNSIESNATKGREFLRVMVSERPFDLRPVFNNGAKKRSGNLSNWEAVMEEVMKTDKGVSTKKRSVGVSEVTLLTQSFLIK
jgi:hypothetical protein